MFARGTASWPCREVTRSRRCSCSAPSIPLTCTALPSPGGRSRSQTVFCWSQELACSVKDKCFCSTTLRSPAHICSPEAVLSASLDESALIFCGSDRNPTHAQAGFILRNVFSTVHSTKVQRIALLLPGKPSASVPGHTAEQLALHICPSKTSTPQIALLYGPWAVQHHNTCMLPAGRDLCLMCGIK